MRRLVKKAVESHPEIRVVAQANHGREAIDLLDQAKPDLLVIDVEMPVLDGIDTVRAIRKFNKTLPIVMFSSLTSNGAEATLDALAAGANDFAAKPTVKGHVQEALKAVEDSLVGKIIAVAGASKSTQTQKMKIPSSVKRDVKRKIDLVAIGVSTGGPEALVKVLRNVPNSFSIPIVIAQHMPPVFTSILAERLRAQTGHEVHEAKDGDTLSPSKILIAPGDYHMIVKRSGGMLTARLNQSEPENSCRPAVDPLFRSVASCCGDRSLAVVLTGMGKDGTNGAKELKAAGGSIVVQDEKSSVVWGMPSEVIRAGCADDVMPPEEIGKMISSFTNSNTFKTPTPISARS